MHSFCRNYSLLFFSLFIFIDGCATTKETEEEARQSPSMQANDEGALLTNSARPAPNPITGEIPNSFSNGCST